MKTRLKYYIQVIMYRYYMGKWPEKKRKDEA